MTSFQIGIAPNKRAAGRFISKVRRALQKALIEETELNQSKIADAIGVHRSVISRELNGRQDITLGRVAELAWAMGREIEFELIKLEPKFGDNVPLLTTSGEINNFRAQPKARYKTTSSAHIPTGFSKPESTMEVV